MARVAVGDESVLNRLPIRDGSLRLVGTHHSEVKYTSFERKSGLAAINPATTASEALAFGKSAALCCAWLAEKHPGVIPPSLGDLVATVKRYCGGTLGVRISVYEYTELDPAWVERLLLIPDGLPPAES